MEAASRILNGMVNGGHAFVALARANPLVATVKISGIFSAVIGAAMTIKMARAKPIIIEDKNLKKAAECLASINTKWSAVYEGKISSKYRLGLALNSIYSEEEKQLLLSCDCPTLDNFQNLLDKVSTLNNSEYKIAEKLNNSKEKLRLTLQILYYF